MIIQQLEPRKIEGISLHMLDLNCIFLGRVAKKFRDCDGLNVPD